MNTSASTNHTRNLTYNTFWKFVILTAGLLLGMGVVFAVAANWSELSRISKFAILQSVVAISAGLVLLTHEQARAGASLLLILSIGALWAFFGQTYQTGVDAWQLFALWSLLTVFIAFVTRHDAAYSLWLIVTLIALRLWQYSYEPHPFGGCYGSGVSNGFYAYQAITTLMPWLVLIGLYAWLSHNVRTSAPEKSLRISRAVALVGGLSLIVPTLIQIIFGLDCSGAWAWLYVLLGLMLLGGLAWSSQRYFGRRDMGFVLALFSFWLIAMSILARGVSNLSLNLGGLLIISIVSIASLAWLGGYLFKGQVSNTDKAHVVDAHLSITSQVIMTFGAFISTLFFVAAFVFFFQTTQPTALFFFAVMAGVAAIALNRQPENSFAYQLTIPLILTCMGFIVFASIQNDFLNAQVITWLMAIATLLFFSQCHGVLVTRFLGMLFVFNMLWAFIGESDDFDLTRQWLWWSAFGMTLAWLVGARWLSNNSLLQTHWQNKSRLFLEGCICAILMVWIGLSGESFLLSAAVPNTVSDGLASAASARFHMQTAVGMACILAASAWAWYKFKPDTNSIHNQSTYGFTFALLSLAVLALAYLSPIIGVLLLLCAALWHLQQHYLLCFALLCALWNLGSLYYSTQMSLLNKSIWLIAIALVMLLAFFLAREKKAAQLTRLTARHYTQTPVFWASVIGSTLLCLAFLNWNIHSKENIIAHGKPIYIPLAPADPRSIMAGDYMRLNWDVPESVRSWQNQVLPWVDPRPAVLLSLDERNIVQTPGALTDADAPLTEPKYIKIKLSFVNGNWAYVTNGYYFSEGAATQFEQAKFGEFRVMPDGTALLVGLCDEHLVKIQ